VCANNPGPLDSGTVARIFRTILRESRRFQKLLGLTR
jgi:hypothetical protein